MYEGFNARCTPGYTMLTEEQIKEIHSASLEVLSSTGIAVDHAEARNMLLDAGCRGGDGGTILIPPHLVENALRSAPDSITIYNQQGEPVMRLGGNRVHYCTGTDLVQTWDLETGKLRNSTLADVGNNARLIDALDEIDCMSNYALPMDLPVHMMYFQSFRALLEKGNKPIFFCASNLQDLELINTMAAEVAGGREALRAKPFHIHYAEPLSPLSHTEGAVNKLFYCADHGLPVNYTPGLMSGASAPATLAGAIILGNAEAMSGVVLHQLRNPGAPIITGFGVSTLDMRTGSCVYACPEYRLSLAASADLNHYHGMPVLGTAGLTDSVCLDQQAAMEWGLTIITETINETNLIHDIGYMGQGKVAHPAALVMCNEIISYARRFRSGFDMGPVERALELIKKVGPGGNFLKSPHTKEHFRTEHWLAGLINRDNADTWMQKGSKDWGTKAVEKARDILAKHTPEPKPEAVLQSFKKLQEQAEQELPATLNRHT